MRASIHLTFRELCARPWGALVLIVVLALGVGAAAFVMSFSLSLKDHTRIIMRDMGKPIRIFPARANPENYFLRGTVDETMPLDVLLRIQKEFVRKRRTIRHVIGYLLVPMKIADADLILAGQSSEYDLRRRPKPTIEAGTVDLGYQAARILDKKPGDTLEVAKRTYTVATILEQTASAEDFMVFAPLRDVQRASKQPGRLNMIRALPCLCPSFQSDIVEPMREEIPEVQVVTDMMMAIARQHMREEADRFGKLLIGVLSVMGGLLAAAYVMLNVRERRGETAILLAIGAGRRTLLTMYVLKLLLLSVLGGVAGYWLGTSAMHLLGPRLFERLPVLTIDLSWMFIMVGVTAALVLVFAAIPVIVAIARDPAETLKREFL